MPKPQPPAHGASNPTAPERSGCSTRRLTWSAQATKPSRPSSPAEHIAAWHPAVGLAVAALFEAVANLAELTRAYDDGDGNQVETGPTAIEVAAYGAALAYLGAPGPD